MQEFVGVFQSFFPVAEDGPISDAIAIRMSMYKYIRMSIMLFDK